MIASRVRQLIGMPSITCVPDVVTFSPGHVLAQHGARHHRTGGVARAQRDDVEIGHGPESKTDPLRGTIRIGLAECGPGRQETNAWPAPS